MTIKKVLTAFFLICLSVFSFFGCAELETFRTIDPYSDGSLITDRFVVTLDKKKLGTSFESVKSAVYDDLILFRNYVYEWVGSFEDDHADVYLDLSKGIVCDVISSSETMMSVNLGFADEYCFALFYGVITLEDEETNKAMDDIGPFLSQILKQDYKIEEMGLFLYKYALINNESIYDKLDSFQIDAIGTNYYTKYTQMTGYDVDDISVSQVFVYPNDKFLYVDDKIYNNADVVEIIDGYTLLGWDLSNKDEGYELSLYKLAPRAMPWYVLALIVSIVVVIIFFIVIKKRNKNKIQIDITKAEAEKDER